MTYIKDLIKPMGLEPKSREAWIDNAKFLAIAFVVAGHVFSSVNNEAARWFVRWIISFNMPLFVFLSGYCALNGLKRIVSIKDLWGYFVKIACRIAVPTLCCSMLYYAFLDVLNLMWMKAAIHLCAFCVLLCVVVFKNSNDYCKKIYVLMVCAAYVYSINSTYWFLGMILLVMSACAVGAYLYNQSCCKWLSVLFLGGAFFCFCFTKCWAEEFLLYFLLGVLIREKIIVNKLTDCRLIVFYIAMAIGLLLVLGENVSFYKNRISLLICTSHGLIWLIRQLEGLLWIFVILAVIRKWSVCYSRISDWGSLTLGIYIIHCFFLQIVVKYDMVNSQVYFISWLMAAFFTTLIILFSTYLSVLFRNNRYSQEIVLGQTL